MGPLDHDFELRIGKMGRDRAPILGPLKGAVGRVKHAGGKVIGGSRAPSPKGLRAHFVKGGAKAARTRGFSGTQRRVVVKARIVPHGAGGGAPLKTHVAYLAREGHAQVRAEAPGLAHEPEAEAPKPELTHQVDYLSRESAEGRALYDFYDGAHDGVDAKALTAAWSDDVRHFRLIISPEDGAAFGDLKPFIREVMADLETRLGTRLEWAAVDHWDTDNPHAHVLIRGRRADGTDLVIPRQIISHDIRERAQEVVTRVLGPRPALAPEVARAREIATPGLTPLDREIMARAKSGMLDSPERGRVDLLQRLERLEVWNLAARHADGRWALAPDLAANLNSLAERTEITRMLEHVGGLGRADYDILEADRSAPAMGRLVHVGIVDELSERAIAIIEGADGRLRYAGFDRTEDQAVFAGIARGALVEFTPRIAQVRPADEAVARIAEQSGGLYSVEHHAALEPYADPALIAANVRRLEAMRRANLVTRRPDGVFGIAPDHRERALAFEAKRLARTPVSARVASYWTLGEQENALGLTQLDRVLAREELAPEGAGRFARDFEAALQRRRLFLIEQGLMGAGELGLSKDALDRLAAHELQSTARKLEAEIGRPVLTHLTNRVEGTYARRIDLAQGRMALLWQRDTAHLVPWRPALEQFAGRQVQGMVRGQSISWSLWRGRTIGLPPM